jgi:hypothetical protein
MGSIFPSAPTPTNPNALATAQTASNVGTAVANAYLNNPNIYTPYGNQIIEPQTYYDWQDPTTGAHYSIPQFRQDQVLSQPEQDIFHESETARLRLAGLANTQTERLGGILGTDFNPLASAPTGGSAASLGAIPQASTTFGDPSYSARSLGTSPTTFGDTSYSLASLPMAQRSFGDTSFSLASLPQAQRTFGETSDYNLARQHVEDALFQRLNPQLDRSRSNIEQRLADQGIRYGSDAYRNAIGDYNREANDLRLGVTQAGSAEQEQAYTQDLRRGQFFNAALQQDAARQQQEYAQLLGRGQFFNQGLTLDIGRQQQEYEQALGRGTFAQQGLRDQLAQQQQGFAQDYQRGQFGNAALAQQLAQAQNMYNAQNLDRSNYLSEQYAQRIQPLNEITALMSGSQVSRPQFANYNQSQIPVTDIAGLYNTNFNQQQSNYNTASNLTGNIIGGALGGLASIYRFGGQNQASDKRVKKNIHRIGTVFAAKPQPVEEPETKKLPVYEYAYKDDPASIRHIGPMAQDVEKIDPEAVSTIRGVKHINVPRTMGNILRAA